MTRSNHFKSFIAALLICGAPLAAAKSLEIEVNGLVCAFCAQGIEKTLKRFPATQAVYVNLENRLVAVQLKDGSDIDDSAMREAITNAGYTVVEIRRTDATLDAIRQRNRKHE